MTEDRPEWLYDAVEDAHCGDLPRNWVYSVCRDACSMIDGATSNGAEHDDDWSDAIHEHADGQVDVYTAELARWYADMCCSNTLAHAEEQMAECYGEPPMNLDERLGVLQYCAIRAITQTIVQAWQDNAE